MKRRTIFLFIFFLKTFLLTAQNVQLTFTASGLSSTIDSIRVLNLTTCTDLHLSGFDTLSLTNSTGLYFQSSAQEGIKIYPNPMNHTSNIEFYKAQKGSTTIEVFDITGKTILQKKWDLPSGVHIMSISGLNTGIFFIRLNTLEHVYTSRLISLNEGTGLLPSLTYNGTTDMITQKEALKNAKTIIQMPYNPGDVFLFEAFSGSLPSIYRTIIPLQDTIIDFLFVDNAIMGDSHICPETTNNVFYFEKLLNHTYTWTYSGNGFSIIAGVNTDSITVNFSDSATEGILTVVATNNCGNLSPQILNIHIDSSITDITATAMPNPICEGDDLQLNGGASGATIWNWTGPNMFTSNIQNPILNNISLADAGIYSLTVGNACGNATPLNTAFVNVEAAPLINIQAVDAAVCVGEDTAFSVVVNGSSLNFQWQFSSDDGTTWNDITGAGIAPKYDGWDDDTLKVDSVVALNNGLKYRCIISDSCTPFLASDNALLTVFQNPSISVQPVSATVCVGDDTSFAINTSGSVLTYQWQVSLGAGLPFNDILAIGMDPYYANWNTPTLEVGGVEVVNNGYVYRCVVTSPCYPFIISSNGAWLTVNEPPLLTSQPVNATKCEGDSVVFGVTITGSNVIKKWQVSMNGGSTWSDILAAGNNPTYEGWTTDSLKVKSLVLANNGYQYRCIATGVCYPPDTSNSAVLSVITTPATPTEGTHQADQTQIIWTWNPVPNATGYKIWGLNDYAQALDVGLLTSQTEIDLFCGVSYEAYVWAYNECGHSQPVLLTMSTPTCVFTCGISTVTWNYGGDPNYTVGTVLKNNKCWMDRNLGAYAMASSPIDPDAMGDLYQWGRADDDHQFLNSLVTTLLSSSDNPGHDFFISVAAYPYDWRSPANDNLWQGVNGINNPCPQGWRLPTEQEMTFEMFSWTPGNATGAFNSTLKWTLSGMRDQWGDIYEDEISGQVWTSNAYNVTATYLYYDATSSSLSNNYRVHGRSVRCIKD